MQKRLLFLVLCCLSANVWAQKPVWDTLFFVQKTLTLYTDTQFLNQCSTAHFQKSKAKYTVFTLGDTNSVQPNRTKICFVWNKKTKQLSEVQQSIANFKTDTANFDIFLMKISFNKKIKTSLKMHTKNINQATILAYLRLRKADFQQAFGLTKLGLFGSYAKDEATEISDVDIIVEFEPNTPDLYDKKEILRNILQNEFDKNVDLCREKYLKPYYKTQILQTSIFV